jgi:hypothetical protein
VQSSPISERQAAIDRGIAWLLKQQAQDGGWHSSTYGQLKDGAAVTALVLDTLSQLPADQIKPHRPAIESGFRFLEPGLAKRGTVAAPDGSLDFPTYASALVLTAIARLGQQVDIPARWSPALRDYLLAAQLLEPRGFASDHPSYGGWDFLGARDAAGITTGTNVSVVAHVLEGLATDKSAAADKARAAAQHWLLRCRRPGGGFCFTPEPMSLNNKAEFADEARTQPRPYGTATCDAIRALLVCGLTEKDDAVQQGIAWLTKRPALEVVPGFEDLPAETEWRRGLRFYYYVGLARILPHMTAAEQTTRAADITRILLNDQHANGYWQNESDRMRENDPLIATCFAVSTLQHLQPQLLERDTP